MGHTSFASDGMFAILTFLPIIFYLVLIVFTIYFVIKVIKFMNEKTKWVFLPNAPKKANRLKPSLQLSLR